MLITAPDGGQLDATEAEDAAAALVAGLGDVDGVDEVAEPQWSPDRSALLVSAQLARDQEDVDDLQDVTASVSAEHPGLEIRQAGDVTLDDAIGEQVAEDLSAAEGISLPVTLVLMLIAFGALIAAGIPVLLAATSVAATIGITAPLSHLVHAEPTVSSMIVLIGMAVGVDYSLFYLKREREERAKGASTLDAVEIAAATSGHSIIVSGLRGDRLDDRPVRRSAEPPSTRWPPARSWSSRSRCSARSRCCPPCWPGSAAGWTAPGCRCSGGSTAASVAAA